MPLSESLASAWRNWTPPDGFGRILTVDAHAGGEPLRVIFGGFPEVPGDTILARRRRARERHDDLRRTLMWEPRGHADMYGCIVLPPIHPDSDFGVLFTHNEGFSTMCGHGIIAVTTVVLEMGLLDGPEARIDTPAGLVVATARREGGRVASVRFRNVPGWVAELDARVRVPGVGDVRYDLAFGGAYYAYVDAGELGVGLGPGDARLLSELGRTIKEAVAADRTLHHPDDPDLAFVYGTIFVGPATGETTSGPWRTASPAHSRNVCVFADGEVDRSPTGTGVSGRMAIHRARGEVAVGEPLVIESIVGSRFTGRVVEEVRIDAFDAVITDVEGSAWITGRHEFLLDPRDPLGSGFLLR